MNFLSTGDFTLFELVFLSAGVKVILLCFSSSRRTDCRMIVYSSDCEISSEVELTLPVPFNEFGRATRKLLFLL